MRLPHLIVRRAALFAAVAAAPTFAACSNEGPLAPEPSTRAVVPGANKSGFVVGWGAVDNNHTNGAAPTRIDSTVATPDSVKGNAKKLTGR